MMGRYGADQLNNTLMFTYIVLSILAVVFQSSICVILAYVLIMITLLRMFSKNHSKRCAENAKFLSLTAPIRGKIKSWFRRLMQSKTHKFYKCKSCGQMIRVPKGKGRICISCPKCRNEFIKKT